MLLGWRWHVKFHLFIFRWTGMNLEKCSKRELRDIIREKDAEHEKWDILQCQEITRLKERIEAVKELLKGE